mgnify:CR=1 FL=1
MYESGPWKEDLKRRRQLLLQYNTKEHFEKDEDKAEKESSEDTENTEEISEDATIEENQDSTEE